jgi:hypothetical protein
LAEEIGLTSETSKSFDLHVEMAIACLQNGLNTLDEGHDSFLRVSFLLEQLRLQKLDKHARHYTPDVMLLAYTITLYECCSI